MSVNSEIVSDSWHDAVPQFQNKKYGEYCEYGDEKYFPNKNR